MEAENPNVAFADARERWRRNWAPFPGIPAIGHITQAVDFEFQTSPFHSYVDYERRVLEQLRGVQRERHVHARDAKRAADGLRTAYADVAEAIDAMKQSARTRRIRLWHDVRTAGARKMAGAEALRDRLESRSIALHELEGLVTEQLRAVRDAVDWECCEGRGCTDLVAAMRADPARPPGVVEYPNVETYVAGDRRRGVFDWPERRALGGADYGFDWRIENPTSRWEATRWRVSWLSPTSWGPVEQGPREIYAVERTDDEHEARVWLLARIPDGVDPELRLEQLQQRAQRERNSLVVVAREMQVLARSSVS